MTFATITIGDTRAAAEATAPQTVPTLRNWAPAGGGFALGARARVFYTDDSLLDMATDFAAGLRVVTGKDVVPQAGSAAAAGDIVLRVAAVPEAPNTPEAYRLSAGDILDLQGAGEPGAFYATRSALQLLRRGGTIPGGTATDRSSCRCSPAATGISARTSSCSTGSRCAATRTTRSWGRTPVRPTGRRPNRSTPSSV
ncbi:glycoside hydrolase family 20 zincin-like fold domain-containing protein [Nocardia goodfellowii]